MKFLDEYRDAELANELIQQIRSATSQRWVLMDVCGGQTHNLVRSGIESALEDVVELIHGPGCPVCVTPSQAIDFAIALSQRPGTIVTSFGDMLRVPGSRQSLLSARAEGGDVRVVYSPVDAVKMAVENPSHEVVFLAVGFETTAPATALAVLHADRHGIDNFSLIPCACSCSAGDGSDHRKSHSSCSSISCCGPCLHGDGIQITRDVRSQKWYADRGNRL